MELTRRQFLQGSVASAAAMGMMGMSMPVMAKDASEVESFEEGQYAFEIAPDPVDEAEIKETIDTEICIVGAGQSGTLAALTAVYLGADVTVISKTPVPFTHGWAVRSINPSFREKEDIPTLLQTMFEAGLGLADARVIKQYLENSGEVLDFVNQVAEENNLEYRYVIHQNGPYSVWSDNSAYHRQNTFINEITPIIEGKGARYLYDCAGYYLEKNEEGRVSGIIVKDLEEGGYFRVNASKGVILCTGDVAKNPSMVKKFGVIADGVPCAQAGEFNTGDGQQMLIWAGAQMQKFPYSCMIHLDPTVLPEGDAPFSDYPWLSVNMNGERFMDESIEYQGKIYSACCQTDIQFYNVGGVAMKEYITTHTDLRYFTWEDAYERGAILEGATIEELAEKMGVPAEKLTATIEAYNAAAESGNDPDFGKRPEFFESTEIDMNGPFYAIHRSPGTLVVVGGAITNNRQQVLDNNNEVIEGLYVAGNTMARFMGMVYQMNKQSGTSCGRAVTSGRLAARFALGDM